MKDTFNTIFLWVAVVVCTAVWGSEVIRYELYEPQGAEYRVSPTVQQGGFGYNGRPSIEFFEDHYYAVWQANSENEADAPGRRLYLSTTKNFINWTKPADFLIRGSVNPLVPSVISGEKQGYPMLYNNKDKALWCFWCIDGLPSEMTKAGLYMSVLDAGSKLWYSSVIFRFVELGGFRYYAIPTQKPVRLRSSRLVLPIRLCRGGEAGREYSVPAFLFSDDDGKNWDIGGTASAPQEPFLQFETAIHQQKKGQIRVFSLPDFRNNLSPGNRLFTTIGTGTDIEGELDFTADMSFANMQTAAGNLATLLLSSKRYAMVMGDIFAEVNGPNLCYNPAIFYSLTGENDFVGGYPFAAGKEISHAQIMEHEDRLYIIYSQNVGSEQKSHIALSWVQLPEQDKHYILPRSKDVMRVYDVSYTRKRDIPIFKRIRAKMPNLPKKSSEQERQTLFFSSNASAALEVEPVDISKQERVEIVLSMKINALQDSGELTLFTIGDRYPVRLVMPAGRAGQLYICAPGTYKKIAAKEAEKWFMVKAAYGSEGISFSIDQEEAVVVSSDLTSQRFYIGANWLGDAVSTNEGSLFSVDLETIITKTNRKSSLFEF